MHQQHDQRAAFEQALERSIPKKTYRVYTGGQQPTLVTIEERHPSPYPERDLVGKAFFERELAELALYGYRLLHGDWLTAEERFDLANRLMGLK